MSEPFLQQRKEAILSALKTSLKSNKYNVQLEPINGSGDIKFTLQDKGRYSQNRKIEGTIGPEDDLSHLQDLFYQ